MLAPRDEAPVALAQADLGLPSEILEGLGQLVDARLDVRGDFGRMAIRPGRFDQDAACAPVAGFRDPALATCRPARIFRRDQADKGGELAGIVEASEVAQFGDDGQRDHPLDPAQGLERLDDRIPVPLRGERLEFRFDALQAVDLLVDGTPPS